MERARARIFIEGRVQGVFYRAFAKELAYRLSLNGWVKNLRDGRVEAIFEGEKRVVEQAIKECYTGPPGARVTKIEVQWEPYTKEEKEFNIIYRY